MTTEKFCAEFCQELSKILGARTNLLWDDIKKKASGGDILAKMKAGPA